MKRSAQAEAFGYASKNSYAVADAIAVTYKLKVEDWRLAEILLAALRGDWR
jgi:hypothetical protein